MKFLQFLRNLFFKHFPLKLLALVLAFLAAVIINVIVL